MNEDPQTEQNWAQPQKRLRVREVPPGAENLNMDGRRLTGPLQGFGPLWEKVYRVRLKGVNYPPQEVMRAWRDNFAELQPEEIHFHPPENGVKAGEVMPIDFRLPLFNGLPEIIPLVSGVEIIYADDLSFTVMTPEGFPISGFNTFSVQEDANGMFAEVRSLIRTMDPVYDLGYRFMGGAQKQEGDWIKVLTNLAKAFGVDAPVEVNSVCLDPRYQWREARHIWRNAAIRTFFYKLGSPVRRLFGKRK